MKKWIITVFASLLFASSVAASEDCFDYANGNLFNKADQVKMYIESNREGWNTPTITLIYFFHDKCAISTTMPLVEDKVYDFKLDTLRSTFILTDWRTLY